MNAAMQSWSSYFEDVLGVRQVLRSEGSSDPEPDLQRPNFIWLVQAASLTEADTQLLLKMTTALQIPDAKIVLVTAEDLEPQKSHWIQRMVPEMVVVAEQGPLKAVQAVDQTRWVEISDFSLISSSQEHKRNVWSVLKTLMSGRGR